MIKKCITFILASEAKIALKRHPATIVGITGSSGKSSTKEAVALVLEQKFRIRKSQKSYNSELGLALAVLGLQSAWHSPFGWISNIWRGFKEVFSRRFPEILVLEMGVDRPKDLEKLLKIARPEHGVVTAIGEVPVHVEFFAGPEELAREKSKLVRSLPAGGYAILNFDDSVVWDMKGQTRAHVLNFGFGSGTDFRASNYKVSLKGISFKVDHKGSTVPVRMRGVFGKHCAYSALAAMALGTIFEINLLEAAEALEKFQPLPGRLRLLPGIKNSIVLDDSYNASPLATHAALDTLGELASEVSGRKIIVLGDMLEIGKFTIQAHKAMGAKAGRIADYLVTVGPRSKFAAEEALSQGMSKTSVQSFSTSREAAAYVKELIEKDGLILVKGSQAMRMERVVEEIMAEPNRARELLCRQDPYWKTKK